MPPGTISSPAAAYSFRVFGPKIIAMRESFSDLALESRFLTHETSGRTLRADIPVHLPPAFHQEAEQIRNQLLAWRFRSRLSVGPDPSRVLLKASPRYRQSSLALLSLVDDELLREEIARELVGEEARVLHERADTLEATMLTAIVEILNGSSATNASIDEIAARFNSLKEHELGRTMSNKWVGSFIRRRLRLATMKTGGVYVVPQMERARASALAKRYGHSGEGLEAGTLSRTGD